MRTIRLITEGAAARWPVIKNAETEALGTVKKSSTKVLIKSSGLCKRLIKTMNENRDLTPILDVCQRLLVTDPVCDAIEIDVRSDATLAPIIDHPILRHVIERLG